MSDDLEARVALLEAELAALKTAFLDAMADPPLTLADRELIIAEVMETLDHAAGQQDVKG